MDAIINYFQKVVEKVEKTFLSFYRSLFGKPVSILFLGIDNAGKTTLLNKLKDDSTTMHMPTHHSTSSEIEIGHMKTMVIDLGGHEAARLVWQHYFYNCHGIVFIVDVSDVDRFPVVKETYLKVRHMEVNGRTVKVPISVLMNKVDLLGHSSESAEMDAELVEKLRVGTGIQDEDEGYGQPVRVSYVSIKDCNMGDSNGALARSFLWLEKMVCRKDSQ